MGVTRAYVTAILRALEGAPALTYSGAYDDVSTEDKYAADIEWAHTAGLVFGYGNGMFGPDDIITREQLLTILYRYAYYKGWVAPANNEFDIQRFTDVDEISGWSTDAMLWAGESGLVVGMGNSMLAPGEDVTKAQLAMFLMRFCK